MNTTIKNIIKKSIAGDSKSQRALYDMHRTRWYMISMRYGKNKMQAEDILQEGLIRIYNDLRQYDDSKSNFATWSSKVLIHAALRYLKKSSWADNMSDIDLAINHVDESDEIIERISSQELTRMIQQLPLGYRLVFNLYAIEGFTHREISSQLGISEGTSKSQLHKARKMLQGVLESQLKISRS